MLDEGRLTDSQGKTVEFRTTVVIRTSNVGAREIAQDSSVGFGTTGEAGLTADEFRKYLAKDPAIQRLFHANDVDEPIPSDTQENHDKLAPKNE